MPGKPYTDMDKAYLDRAFRDHVSVRQMCEFLGRSRSAVVSYFYSRGLSIRTREPVGNKKVVSKKRKPETRKLKSSERIRKNKRDVPCVRPCMRCGEKFKSTGFGNRLCVSCRPNTTGFDYPVYD